MHRAISLLSALVATAFLVLVLADATLIDRRPPTVVEVRLSATTGDDRVAEPISSINVEFSESLRTSTAESRFHLQPNVPGTLTWDGPTLIFTPSEPLPTATDFSVTVDEGFVDLAGNVATTGIDAWAFATAGPPRVVRATPADGAVGLPTNTSVELEFDRLMDTTTVEAAITIDPPVAFKPTWSGEAVSLAFEPALVFGTTYTLEVGTSATDTSGAHLVAPFATYFSTVSAGLNARVVPIGNVAGIAVRSPIAVLFDSAIDPTSAPGALTITPSISGDLAVTTPPGGADGSALVFTPSGPMAEHTTYTVSLAPVVHRLGDPAQVAAGRTWSFTTGSQTESAQNQIAFLSERSGIRNVWLVNPDGTNARQLTWELAPVIDFDVTGDGKRFVFAAGGIVGAVNVDGNDRRVLTDDGAHETAPRLSPDDTLIVLARRSATGEDFGWWQVPSPWTFGDTRQILAGGAPSEEATQPFSPTYQPAFDATGGRVLVPVDVGQLVLVDLTTPEPVTVARTNITAMASPIWSSAIGAFLAPGIVGIENARAAVYRFDLAGSSRALDGTSLVNGALTEAEDGRLLFTGGTDVPHLVLFDPATGEARTLTNDSLYVEHGAAFSPDGRRIVFARTIRLDTEGSAGLWLVDIASRSLTRLTIDGSDPRWLP